MKKILITLYQTKSHSLYKQFINNPPEGYQYFTLDDFFDEFIFEKHSNIFLEILAKIRRNKKIIDVAKKNKIDLIYCCDGVLLFNSPIPWVLEFEHATSLIAHNFSLWKIAKYILPLILKQKKIKYLIPWTEAGASSLRQNLNLSQVVLQKIKPIHLCLGLIEKFDDIEKRKVKQNFFSMLFVTSVNYNGEGEFYSKGGRIIVKVFEKLKKEYSNVRLILRSKIPKEFSYLKNDPNVEVYEESLEKDNFERLFLGADIFLFPGYQSPGMAFLDAMNYNLPIITTDIFANREMVISNKNGYTIQFPLSSKVNYLLRKYGIKNIPFGGKAEEDAVSEKMVDDFIEKIMKLKDNNDSLMEMGANSKKLILKEFSLEKRNKELKSVFDRSLNL